MAKQMDMDWYRKQMTADSEPALRGGLLGAIPRALWKMGQDNPEFKNILMQGQGQAPTPTQGAAPAPFSTPTQGAAPAPGANIYGFGSRERYLDALVNPNMQYQQQAPMQQGHQYRQGQQAPMQQAPQIEAQYKDSLVAPAMPSWVRAPAPGTTNSSALTQVVNPVTGEVWTAPSGGYTYAGAGS